MSENGKTTEATATTSVNYFEERKKSKASGAVEKPEEKKHDDGARVSPPASRCDVKQLHHVQVDTSSRNGINGSARKRPRDQKSRTQHEEVSSASLDVVDHTPSLTGGSEISSTYEEMQVRKTNAVQGCTIRY